VARDLRDAVAALERLHQHFLLNRRRVRGQPEAARHVGADGAEAVLTVGEPDVPAVVDRQHDQLRPDVADQLIERAVELIAAAFAARGDDQVGLAGADGLDEFRDVGGLVRAVGVDEDDNLGGGGSNRHPQRVPLTAAVVHDDPGAVLDGDIARAVARVAVDHENLVGVGAARVDDRTDDALFVLGGNHDGDARGGHDKG